MGKIVRTLSKDGLVLCCAVDSTDAISRMEQNTKPPRWSQQQRVDC